MRARALVLALVLAHSRTRSLAHALARSGDTRSTLMKLAEEFNVAVYLTNQVVSDPGGGMTFVQDPKVA